MPRWRDVRATRRPRPTGCVPLRRTTPSGRARWRSRPSPPPSSPRAEAADDVRRAEERRGLVEADVAAAGAEIAAARDEVARIRDEAQRREHRLAEREDRLDGESRHLRRRAALDQSHQELDDRAGVLASAELAR